MRASAPVAELAEDFFETANLSPSLTGLPMVVWISERGGARHDVRARASLVHGRHARLDLTASVSVRPDVHIVAGPELGTDDMTLVQRWIERNRDTLVAYWDGELLTGRGDRAACARDVAPVRRRHRARAARLRRSV
jgi:hypothetical protein